MKRNIKFWGIRGSAKLRDIHIRTVRVINEISSEMRSLIVSGKIKQVKRHSAIVDSQFILQLFPASSTDPKVQKKISENKITDTDIKDLMNHIFNKAGAVSGIENYKRSLVKYVMERYAGYTRRNNKGKKKKKKIPNIRIHEGKNLYFKDNGARLNPEKKTITLTTLFGKIEVKYAKRSRESAEMPFRRTEPNRIETDTRYVTDKMNAKIGGETFKIKKVDEKKNLITLDRDPPNSGYVRIERNNFGGNLTFHPKKNSYCMVALVDCPMEPKYAPLNTLSFDMNKTPKHWLTFNDGSVIPMDKRIKNLAETIRNTNKILALKNKPVSQRFYIDENTGQEVHVRSKHRRKLRKFWQVTHKQLKTLCGQVARDIADKAISTSSLLAIDSVKGGDKTGTYGQDHITPMLQRICENEGIPFYVVPCQNTSRRCSSCGYTSKENRKTVNDFECLACGHKELSHLNASKNIANIANEYLRKGKEYGNYSKRF